MSKTTVSASATGLPSRRSVLAAGTAVAAVSASGIAKASAALDGADPAIAAINDARRTLDEYDAARAPIRAVYDKHPELRPGFEFVAKADGEMTRVSTIEHLTAWLDTQGPSFRVKCKRTFAEEAARILGIEKPPVEEPTPEALEAWEIERAAVIADFERASRAYDLGQRRANLPELYAISEKAADLHTAAEDKALASIPTTAAGAIALLTFYAEMTERFDPNSEFLAVLKNALPPLTCSFAI